MSNSKEKNAAIKEDILTMLDTVKRTGVDDLKKWLLETDFFAAPSSTRFHCAYEGGLAEHSWNVADLLFKKNEQFNLYYDYDTLAICGLCHDLCKINMYKLVAEDPTQAQMKYLMSLCNGRLPAVPGKLHKGYVSDLINHYVNKTEKPPEYTFGEYKVEDQFPIGHGEKSVVLAQRFIELTDDEAVAIRWHMASFDAGIHFNFPSGFSYRAACDKSPLVTLLFTSDAEASAILERV